MYRHEEERERKARLAKHVRRNRQAIVLASNSSISLNVRRDRIVDFNKQQRDIGLLSQEFAGILKKNMAEKNKMQRSYESLNVNKRNILIEQSKKRKIEDLRHEFKKQALVVLGD